MKSRIYYMVKKEFTQVMRDPRMLFIALMAPVIQIIIFGYVATLDIKHISTSIYDQDHSFLSRKVAQSLKNAGYFDINYYPKSEQENNYLMDANKIKCAVIIPPDFTRKYKYHKSANMQIILDGTDSNTAIIAQNYIAGIIASTHRQAFIDPRMRVWYNPELKSVNFFIPAIICMLLMLVTMLLTAFAIVKEKERGTMEQLIVSPLKPKELILGKMLPFIIISLIDVLFVLIVGTLWFNVPIVGSIPLLFILSLLFIITSLGFGIFISTISSTQQQAMLTAIFFILPSILLSGFIFPVSNMPKVIQLITYFIPARYFVEIVRGIFLKGVGIEYLWSQTIALIILGIFVLTLSVARFKKKL